MRFAPTIRRFWPCLLLGCLTVANAASSPLKGDELYAEIRRFNDALGAKPLPAPYPGGMTEADLLDEMSLGSDRVDPAFCERIGLEALSDRIQPILQEPFPDFLGKEIMRVRGTLVACRLFLLRGRLLCQQGKAVEGQQWMLKAHQLARRPQADHNLFNLLCASALENLGLHAAANHAETWSESDRLAYIKSLEQLAPLPRIDVAAKQDNRSLPPEYSIPTWIKTLKPLTPAQRKEKLAQTFGQLADFQNDPPSYLRRLQTFLENLTPENWEDLLASVPAELHPLTTERLRAFQARNAEALALVQADEALAAGRIFTSPDRKAEPLFRVLFASSIASAARTRLDTELKLQLLKQVLRRGADFGEKDLVGLTDASGNPLRLGKSEDGNHKAIKAGSSVGDFLTLGPIK
ncbi:MAG: hypothetical protein RL492_1334 [Verrucomicrobiota bacterium]|jgi:hypothetical protein